jgi:BNR repeat-like domain
MRKRLSAAVAISLFLSVSGSQCQSIYVHRVAKGSSPAIAADGKHRLHATFEAYENDSKVSDIFYTMSTDDGATWSSPKDISNTPGISTHSTIATEKTGAVDVIWSDNSEDVDNPDIFFARSIDQGSTWSKPMDISHTPGISTEPALAVGPDNSIHVVWSDTSKGEKNKDIFYVSSKDGGRKWAKDDLLPAIDISNTPGSSYEPVIAVGQEGAVHVAWVDTTPGETHPDIYYVRSENDCWTKPIDISNSPRISSHPTLACDKGKIFLAWSDNSRKETAPDIWLSIVSKNNKFTKPINVSNTPGVSSEPTAAAADGQLAVAWSDTTTGTESPSIYARVSFDNADDFSLVMNFSGVHRMAKHPRVTVIGNKMFVTWEDVAGSSSTIKVGCLELKGLATGPSMQVDPAIHGVMGNMH